MTNQHFSAQRSALDGILATFLAIEVLTVVFLRLKVIFYNLNLFCISFCI